VKLKTYLQKNKITMLAFAATIEVNVSTVSRICRGVVIPSRSTMQRIFEATGSKVKPTDLVQFHKGK